MSEKPPVALGALTHDWKPWGVYGWKCATCGLSTGRTDGRDVVGIKCPGAEKAP